MRAAHVTLAAYTDFGAWGLRGVGMYHLVRDAWRRGLLREVIAVSGRRCQYEFDRGLIRTLPGESRLISALAQVRRAWRGFPARWLGETIFDHYAASRLAPGGGTLVASAGMVRTARRARVLGYRTVLYAGHAHPRYLLREIRAEQRRLGLRRGAEDLARRLALARFAAHVDASDHVLAVSEFVRATFVEFGYPGERIFVTPLGVDLARFEPTPPPPAPLTYLFVGHVDGSTGILKGLHDLLEAWTRLALPDGRLVVCGKLGGEARRVIGRYDGALRDVALLGPVSHPKRYYREASVFVLPTIAEGMPKVVIEAMASGRPVIVSEVPRPVVREGVDGFYVGARDPDGLAARMRYFHRHPGEVARMGQNARRRAEEFGWDRFSRQIADILEGVR
jgi:glycosyltransferase involved in cell wall biosynthesis